jgi:hypothetical protein
MIFIQKMATKLAAIFFVWSYNTIMNAGIREEARAVTSKRQEETERIGA